MKRFILLFILFDAFIAFNTYAQTDERITKADEQIIQKHIEDLNLSIVTADLSPKDKRNKRLIDSLLLEYKPVYGEGTVTSSPDEKFKVFVIQGTDCGSNCSTFYKAFIHLPGKEKILSGMDLFPVIHIYKLKDNKYLILQKGIAGGGNLIDDCLQATLIGFKSTKVIEYPIHHPAEHDKSIKSLRLIQSGSLTDGDKLQAQPNLIFSPHTERLSYTYRKSEHPITSDNIGNINVYSGYFNYKNGKFIFQKETKTSTVRSH